MNLKTCKCISYTSLGIELINFFFFFFCFFLSKVRDQTYDLMVPSRIHFSCAVTGTPRTHQFQVRPEEIMKNETVKI